MTPTIQTEIELLQNTKDELRTAIMEKGVTVSNDLFSTYPTRISQISTTPGDKDDLFKSLIDRSITSLVVPDGTEILRPQAFEGCENITSIILPNSLQTICNGALTGLQGITTLVIPDSVTTIEGSSSFHQTSSLTTLTIGTGITSIGNMVFYGNPNLTSITIKATTPPVLGSNNNAFDQTNNCPIYVPEESVDAYKTAWSKYASRIQATTYKAKLTLTDNSQVFLANDGTGVLTASELASYKSTLDALWVNYGVVNTVQDEACKGFSNLRYVYLDSSVTTIGDYAFNNCPALYSFSAQGLTSWGQYALSQTHTIYGVIPEGITSTYGTFAESPYLEEITFPKGFLELGPNTFYQCTSLKKPVLPETLSIISAENTFYGCTGLESINFLSQYPPTVIDAVNNNMFDNTNDCPIYVPADSVDYYKQANGWSKYADRIHAVPSKMIITYDNGGTIETISVPEDHTCDVEETPHLTAIKPCDYDELYASQHNPSDLRTITICENVNEIELSLDGCTGLESITIEGDMPYLYNSDAFDDVETNSCPIYVPAKSLQYYLDDPEWGNYASRIVAFGNAITFTPTNGDPAISVKDYELATANYVQSTDVPSTIKNGAGSLEIGEGVTRIGTFAFQNGSSLTSVTLPSTLERIDEAALMGCTSLTGITVKATTPPTLGSSVFDNTNDCPIYVPEESVEDYKFAWSQYASRIQAFLVPKKMIITYDNGGTIETISVPEDHICNGQIEEISYPTNIRDCDFYDFYESQHPSSDIKTITIGENAEIIELSLYGCTGLESITCLATTPPEIYGDVFNPVETNDCPIYVPTESLQVYLDDPNWGMYSSRLQAIPEPVVPKFVRIAETTDATDGKYLIVDMDSNKALDASLITSTTSTSNGINNFSSGNTISVTIEQDGTITANAENLNAAAYYDATNQNLYWEDGNNVKYYLSQRRTNSSNFKYSSTTSIPTATITPYKGDANYITLKESYYLGGDGSNTVSWYSSSNATQIGRVALFKYVEE